MSHFTVLVIGEKPEELLEPFQENNMSDCPEKYLEFDDIEDAHLEEYKTKSTKKVVYKGKSYNTFDNELKTVIAEDLGFKRSIFGSEEERIKIDAVVESLKPKEIKFIELFKTFEEYMKEWCGYESRDEEIKRYGNWNNPNSKWDWFQIGGRWRGFFKLKKNVSKQDKTIGPAGTFKNEAKHDCDQARKNEIDFQWMFNSNRLRSEKSWAEYEEAIKTGFYTTKDRDGQDKRLGFSDERGDGYWHFGVAKGDTKETYIKKHSSLATFAVIKDGKWYEKGEMGWFGCSSNEKDEDVWNDQWNKLVLELPDDTLLTLVDCHI